MGLDEDDDEYVGSGCDEKEAEEEADDDEGKDELEEENEDMDGVQMSNPINSLGS